MKKILMVLAHPDDEIIFGWPILQDPNIQKKILICSSDFNNPSRSWCKNRKDALYDIGFFVGSLETVCLDYDSEFYRQPTRPIPGNNPEPDGLVAGPWRNMCKEFLDHIQKMSNDCDAIFTHNPYGEYGHIDHIMLFDLIIKNVEKPVLITDIKQNSNWAHVSKKSKKIEKLFYNNIYKSDCVLDDLLLQFCKSQYEARNAWTWNKEVVNNCNVYRI